MNINSLNSLNPSNVSSVNNEVVAPLNATTAATNDVEPRALVKPIEEGSEATTLTKDDNPDKLQEAVAELSDTMSMMKKGLSFRVDDSSGISVVNVMDMDSGEMIRQIPTEEALELAQKLFEVSGMLMKTEA